MHSLLRSDFLISLVSLITTFTTASTTIYQHISSSPPLTVTSPYQNDNPINPQAVADIANIHQAINLFAIAVDQHNLGLLSQVFTNDVTANFSLPSGEIQHGLPVVKQVLATLQAVPSQHDQSTFLYASNRSQTAHTTTYLTATFFGSGDLKGQVYTNYGRYEDDLIKTSAGWRISDRTLINTGGTGNIKIVFPD